MRLILFSQLVAIAIVSVATMVFAGKAESLAVVYGATLGVLISMLTRRSTDRALEAAVVNTTHGMLAMYSGLILRYAVAILGLLAGFRVLHLPAEPMLAGFVLMIIVQLVAAMMLRPQHDNREA